jgi:hypothetical protein
LDFFGVGINDHAFTYFRYTGSHESLGSYHFNATNPARSAFMDPFHVTKDLGLKYDAVGLPEEW